MEETEKVIQFPGEKRWVLKKRDYDLLMAILNIQAIAEELEKPDIFLDPQKVKALGSALGKGVGNLVNIMRGLKTRHRKISPQILVGMKEQLLELTEEVM
jgi:hypothetical protein